MQAQHTLKRHGSQQKTTKQPKTKKARVEEKPTINWIFPAVRSRDGKIEKTEIYATARQRAEILFAQAHAFYATGQKLHSFGNYSVQVNGNFVMEAETWHEISENFEEEIENGSPNFETFYKYRKAVSMRNPIFHPPIEISDDDEEESDESTVLMLDDDEIFSDFSEDEKESSDSCESIDETSEIEETSESSESEEDISETSESEETSSSLSESEEEISDYSEEEEEFVFYA